MEQAGLELTLVWDPGITGNRFTGYAPMLGLNMGTSKERYFVLDFHCQLCCFGEWVGQLLLYKTKCILKIWRAHLFSNENVTQQYSLWRLLLANCQASHGKFIACCSDTEQRKRCFPLSLFGALFSVLCVFYGCFWELNWPFLMAACWLFSVCVNHSTAIKQENKEVVSFLLLY